MTKKIYIPTEEELIEMGFTELSQGYALSLNRFSCITFNKNGWFCNGQIYPRSKQGLIEFISNFSPND